MRNRAGLLSWDLLPFCHPMDMPAHELRVWSLPSLAESEIGSICRPLVPAGPANAALILNGQKTSRGLIKMRFHSIVISTLSLLFFSLLAANPASASTIHVPADYPTIQAAINAASDGDSILVSDGTYTEN